MIKKFTIRSIYKPCLISAIGITTISQAWACEEPKVSGYDEVGCLYYGLAVVKKDDKWGFIDKTGKVVVPIIYDDVGFFYEGLATINKDDKFGFIDEMGKVVVPIIYDDIDIFSEGLAAVKQDNKWGFIDKTGKVIVPIIYDDVTWTDDDMIKATKDGVTTLIKP